MGQAQRTAPDTEQLRQLIGLTEHDASQDDFPARSFDAVVIACGNASQTTYFYELCLGMELEAYGGPDTGLEDRRSWVLRAGDARLVLVGATGPDSPVATHHQQHGDGVLDISLEVTDVDRCVERARAEGVTVIEAPYDTTDDHGTVRRAVIGGFGDVRHTLVDRSAYDGVYLPGYVPRTRAAEATLAGPPPATFVAIDHAVAAVPAGELDDLGERYSRMMGLSLMDESIEEDEDLEVTAQRMRTYATGDRRVKFAFAEPAPVEKASAIDVFLDAHGGPGCQHLALATDDIVATAARLRQHGVELIDPPDDYYDDPGLRSRLEGLRLSVDELKEHRILVDDDDEGGYLLQVFTRPVGDRPTMFLEWLERRGSLGFGKGNFGALAQANEMATKREGHQDA